MLVGYCWYYIFILSLQKQILNMDIADQYVTVSK